MNKNYVTMKLLGFAFAVSLFVACGADSTSNSTQESSSSDGSVVSSSSVTVESSSSETIFLPVGDCDGTDSYIVFSDVGPSITSTNVVNAVGNVVTISCSGNYYLSGSASDAQVVVQTATADSGNVYLYLNGITLTNTTDAPIYVKNAEKTLLYMVDGTTNTFTDAATRPSGTDTASACIFSKDDLTLKGTGTLVVNGKYNNGIHSSNDLRIRDIPIVNVTAVNNGIKGKRSVDIENGVITVTTTSGDGIKADTTDDDGTKGGVLITGGTFTIQSGADGIQAYDSLTISDGTFSITTGTGIPNTSASTGTGGNTGGRPGQSSSSSSTDEDSSYKGLKSDAVIYITGGTFTINAVEDAIHSNDVATIGGGTFAIAARRGAHADNTLNINGGTLLVTTSYEGFEAGIINFNGGYTSVTATDDAWNASTSDATSVSTAVVNVNGGTHIASAGGDGLDSNGDFYVNDGFVIIEQNNTSSNGILDVGDGSNYKFYFKGGTLLGVGTSSMGISSQISGTYLGYTTLNASAGQLVSVANSSGSILATMKTVTSASSGLFMSSNYNTNYKFYVGGTFSGTLTSDPGATGISYATSGTISGATAK